MPLTKTVLEGGKVFQFFRGFDLELAKRADRLSEAFKSEAKDGSLFFIEECLTCSCANLAIARSFAEKPHRLSIPTDGFPVAEGDLALAMLKTNTFGMCLELQYPVVNIDIVLRSGLVGRFPEYILPFHGDIIKLPYYYSLYISQLRELAVPFEPRRVEFIVESIWKDILQKTTAIQLYEPESFARGVALLRVLELLIWYLQIEVLFCPDRVAKNLDSYQRLMESAVRRLFGA